MTKAEDIAWAAGFLDGEGCFRISRGPSHGRLRDIQYTAVIVAVQVDPAPLLFLQELFGGTIQPHDRQSSRRAASFHWQISSRLAGEVVRTIRPYLRVKAAAADLLPLLLATTGVKGKRTDGSTLARREAIYLASRRLNQTGVARGEAVPPTETKMLPQLHLMERTI